MPRPRIHKVSSVEDRELPVFAEFDDVMAKVRRRAFELFSDHGFKPGHDFDDWLQAEREFCWPSAELAEKDDAFEVSVALPGFDDVSVTANPHEIIVKAARESRQEDENEDKNVHWSDFTRSEVFRRIELPVDVDVSKVRATMKDGMLRINAAKLPPEPAKVVEVSTAA